MHLSLPMTQEEEVCEGSICWEDCANNMHCFNVVGFSESTKDWRKAYELCHRTGHIGPDGLGRLGRRAVGLSWTGGEYDG